MMVQGDLDMGTTGLPYKPKVTIVIPVYNGELFVKDAIDSAINQSYDHIEVLVINDGSTDGTDSIVSAYRNKIRYIKKDNGGVSTVLNLAIREMTGEYMSWLSHDDRYLPTKVERQVEQLNEIIKKANGDLESIHKVVPYCSNERIDIHGNVISRKRHIYKESESIIKSMLNNIKHYNICGCAVLIPKYAFEEVGNFREDIPTCSDADMWYRMMFAGYRFMFMNEVLVQSRQHQGQVSKRKQEQCNREQILIHCEIAKNMLEILTGEKDVWKLGCYLIQRGFDTAAKVVFKEYYRRFGKNKIIGNIEISLYRLKHDGRNALRFFYRKLTSK